MVRFSFRKKLLEGKNTPGRLLGVLWEPAIQTMATLYHSLFLDLDVVEGIPMIFYTRMYWWIICPSVPISNCL